jgi:hypothetical protein
MRVFGVSNYRRDHTQKARQRVNVNNWLFLFPEFFHFKLKTATVAPKTCTHCLCKATGGLYNALRPIRIPGWATDGLKFIRPRSREGCYYVLKGTHHDESSIRVELAKFTGQLQEIALSFRRNGIRVQWLLHLDKDAHKNEHEHLHGWILFTGAYDEAIESERAWLKSIDANHQPHRVTSNSQSRTPFASDTIVDITSAEVASHSGRFNSRGFVNLVESRVQDTLPEFQIETHTQLFIWGNNDGFKLSFAIEGKGSIERLA